MSDAENSDDPGELFIIPPPIIPPERSEPESPKLTVQAVRVDVKATATAIILIFELLIFDISFPNV
jgi:hypothetical protein